MSRVSCRPRPKALLIFFTMFQLLLDAELFDEVNELLGDGSVIPVVYLVGSVQILDGFPLVDDRFESCCLQLIQLFHCVTREFGSRFHSREQDDAVSGGRIGFPAWLKSLMDGWQGMIDTSAAWSAVCTVPASDGGVSMMTHPL